MSFYGGIQIAINWNHLKPFSKSNHSIQIIRKSNIYILWKKLIQINSFFIILWYVNLKYSCRHLDEFRSWNKSTTMNFCFLFLMFYHYIKSVDTLFFIFLSVSSYIIFFVLLRVHHISFCYARLEIIIQTPAYNQTSKLISAQANTFIKINNIY